MVFTKKQLEMVSEISNKLDYFKEQIEKIDYIHNKYSFFEVMREFRRYLVEISVGNNFQVFKHSEKYKYYKKYFTKIHEYYLRSLESMQALSVITKSLHNYFSLSDIIDKDLLKKSFIFKGKEISSIDFSKVKNFVFAGSGPFPETLLYLYENTSVENLIGLDYNHEAIYMSGEMVSGLSMDKIKLKQYDARNYDYKDADVVSIPLFVSVKKEIVEQIIKTGKDDIQILIANPKGFLNIIYDEIGELDDRVKISFREDLDSEYVTEEIIKLEKYNF